MKTSSRTLTTCLVSAALLLGTAGLAQAYDPNATATNISEAIAAVAPDAGDILEAASTGDVFAAQVAASAVIVPEDPSTPISITSADPELPDLAVTLPDLAGADDARQAEDGTLVYTSDDDASLAVQPLADGSTRFLSVLENQNAPERYDYTFDGFDLALQADGSVLVTDGDAPVGFIAAPWATDADGVAVPTRYEVDGSTLTQVVEHTDGNYTYPITADPSLTYGWGIYYNFYGWEIKTLGALAVAAGGAGAFATCQGISRLPHAAAKFATLLCAAVGGGPTIQKVWSSIVSIYKSKTFKTSACYQMKVIGGFQPLKEVSGKNCLPLPVG